MTPDNAMSPNPNNPDHRSRVRWLGWGLAAGLLALPWIAMQFTSEVNWGLNDFIVFGVMLLVTGGMFELVVRVSGDGAYRAAMGIALLGTFGLVWVNGAVGLIGHEGHPANLMYAGVLAVGITGALWFRRNAHGMAKTLTIMAVVQVLVPVTALVAGMADLDGMGPTIGATLLFVALWLASAALFRKARD